MIAPQSKPRNLGALFALSSAVLFGATVPAAKYLLGEINPWILAGFLYLGAGIGMSVILFVKKYLLHIHSAEANLQVKDAVWIILATFFGGIIGPLLLMFGLNYIPAASASLLLNFECVFTAIIAWVVVKEHTSKELILGSLLIILGGIVLNVSNDIKLNNLLGPLLILGACFSWAIDNNVTRNLSLIDPLKLVTIKSLIAGATNVVLALIFFKIHHQQVITISFTLFIGFLGYALSIMLFVYALRHIGTARTSAYFSIAPFIGACLSIIFLHEVLSIQLIFAGVLMGVGIWLHLSEYHMHLHVHEPLIHEHKHHHDEHHQHEHSPNDPLGEPHSHLHEHDRLEHNHIHYPDIHHRHKH